MPGLPDVSLISSWHSGVPKDGVSKAPPAGIVQALQAGVGLLDLYFLSHLEIPWYLEQCGRKTGHWKNHEDSCPLSFASALEPEDIERIGDALLDLLVSKHYTGRLIGPRPRFTALATYWPLINGDNAEYRLMSIRAIQNCLLLARHLGCHHVEIVGGAAFTEKDGKSAKKIEERDAASKEARTRRHDQLCQSLHDIFLNDRGKELFPTAIDVGDPSKNGPYLCLEIEPGQAFLINDVQSFIRVHQTLKKTWKKENLHERVLLNVDLAHMFLADADQPKLKHAGERQLKLIEGSPRSSIMDFVGHFHVSDHARTHASDLCPGSYHFIEPDYTPWLKLAAKLVGRPRFSNTMAIEMESCADIHEVMRAMGRTRSWLQLSAHDSAESHPAVAKGMLLAVDVVNSTEILARGAVGDLSKGAERIDTAISSMCRQIQGHRGSVYSFTGDGVVAMFDRGHFGCESECAEHALLAAESLYMAMTTDLGWNERQQRKLALRISLHWGNAVIPAAGPLRHQILGADVIIACRLLNAVNQYDDKGQLKPGSHRFSLACSKPAMDRLLPSCKTPQWLAIPTSELEDRFKGVHWAAIEDHVEEVHIRHQNPFG